MSYINGSKLHIFPSSGRTANGGEDNWLSEYNLSSIVNQFIDGGRKSSFVISGTTGEGKPIEFNIAGYYIKVDDAQDIVTYAGSDNFPPTDESSDKASSFVTFTKQGSFYCATLYFKDGKLEGKDWWVSTEDSSSKDADESVTLQLFDGSYNIPATSRISVVGLTSLEGCGSRITVQGGKISSLTIDASQGTNGNGFKIENGKLTNINFDFRGDSGSAIKIENGKLTNITLKDVTISGGSIENATNAVNVTGSINGKSITTIFESNGTTVKEASSATNATNATNDSKGRPIESTYAKAGDVYTKAEIDNKLDSQALSIDDGELT